MVYFAMGPIDEVFWQTEPELFASLPGGAAIIDWFGFMPSFHDAHLADLTISNGTATIKIDAFRMTSEVDERGYFILDRHAQVTIAIGKVSGLLLRGDAQSIISQLGIRRIAEDRKISNTCVGPRAGDFEVSFDTSYGMEGTIFGEEVVLSLTPENPS
ncbi:hypothetical protein [Sphingomonas melonis]|uniref:Uncharacterized protein n=1 Tax=Sphingomonas melonis TaxID=152682 RepID=A0A7Y9FS85_9SPHN|nr:hypothetical protein [Sphingomonas melonis]NYD92232.1 hypothetical protein [Sphingomonas melonis]